MKKAILSLMLLFAISFSVTGCKFESNDIRAPQELTIFHSSMSLEQFNFDYLEIENNSNDSVMIYDYDDMIELFTLADALVLTKSYEGYDMPEDFDYLCRVKFFRQGKDGRPDVSYYFYVSTAGEICYRRQRLAASDVYYTAESTAILNEVNQLIELYNQP
jgi:hypothetical protein